LVASGFVDAVIEGSLKPYDYCAHVPIIEGAGGIVSDFQGQIPGLGSDGRIIAAGDPALHALLVERLN
jgi:fructose-1,6-bisphosphatase/inositol monophosphatase family enzyme